MKILSSQVIVAWLLASQAQFVSGYKPRTRLSSAGFRAGDIHVSINLPKFPWAKSPKEVLAVEQPPPPRYKARLKMGLEVILQGLFASEFVSRMATFLSVDPSAILLAANLGVHAMWQLATWRNYDLRRFMHRHFLLRSDDLDNQRVHTILLSGFSHEEGGHFASNMGQLLLLGPQISKQLGSRAFSYFYVAAIYASDLFYQLFYISKSKYITQRIPFGEIKIPTRSLGASGAISSLLCYYCLKFPLEVFNMTVVEEFEAKFYNRSVTPSDKKDKQEIPAVVIGVLIIISDLFPEPGSNIAHGAHLGGHLFGACFFLAPRLCKMIRNYKRMTVRSFRCSCRGFRKRLANILWEALDFTGEVLSELRLHMASRMEEICNQVAAQCASESCSGNRDIVQDMPRPCDTYDYHSRLLKLMDAEMNCDLPMPGEDSS